MSRTITPEEKQSAATLLQRARAALKISEAHDQQTVDRLARAISWATANEPTFVRLTQLSVEESKMGSLDGVPARRFKIVGILRDALRTKTIGVIEEIPKRASSICQTGRGYRWTVSRNQSAGHHGQYGDPML